MTPHQLSEQQYCKYCPKVLPESSSQQLSEQPEQLYHVCIGKIIAFQKSMKDFNEAWKELDRDRKERERDEGVID